MTTNWKKLLRAIGIFALPAAFVGGALFFFALFGMLGMFPLYVTYGMTVLGAVCLLGLFLLGCGYLPAKARRGVKAALLCALLVSGVYMGHGFWRDSLPTMDDRDNLLWQYEPFRENTKAVTLDEASTLQFPRAELRLDGATALYPVSAGFVQAVVYPKGEYDRYGYGRGTVECTGTVDAYERIIRNQTDIIFAAAPSQAQLDMAEQAGVALHMTPIGREAFVFFVNSRNPVTGLTVEQVQGIYTGKITNWKKVGGKNQSIRPSGGWRTAAASRRCCGSWTACPSWKPEEEDRIEGMGGIIRQVASYRNYKNAIGFSFRFYSTEMVQSNDICLLALNGVEPTKETIRDGSYPISSEFYAVTAAPIGQPAPQENNEQLASFLDWMTSSQGQEIVEQTGYVPLH